MRYCLLTRGPMASGKTTWIEDNNLTNYTISLDEIRLMLGSLSLKLSGDMKVNSSNEKEVMELFYKILKKRFEEGCFTVIDATNINISYINEIERFCKKYKYKLFVKEFFTDLQDCISNNKSKDKEFRVDEEIILKKYNEFTSNPLPKRFNKVEKIQEILDFKEINNFRVIGDIHGCCDVLKEATKDIDNEDKTFIFLGDYFDRGIQNVETFRYLQNLQKKKNVIMLEGNHDLHLRNYYNEEEYELKESFKKTKEEFIKAGITKKEVEKFYKNLKCSFFIKVRTFNLILSHGGVSRGFNDIKNLLLINSKDFIKGVGSYNDHIDEIFKENSSISLKQIHGHRSLLDTSSSFSLEDSVEFGGNLLCIDYNIKDAQFRTIAIKNDTYDKELNENGTVQKLFTNCNIVNSMSKMDRLIKIKKIDDDIVSINFNRLAFKKRNWNVLTCKARGLFVHSKTGEVIARSYDKFFNVDELEKEKSIYIKELEDKFPIKIYKKENGFLGILSCYNDELRFFSKSTDKSTFAKWFKNLFELSTTEEERLRIKEELKKNNDSLTFEVIDVENDREHPIPYNNSHLVLLNSIKNDLKEEIKDKNINNYIDILKNSKIKNKELVTVVQNEKEFIDFLSGSEFNEIKYILNNEPFEGYVCELKDGQLIKLKTLHYKLIKEIRGKLKTISITDFNELENLNNNGFDLVNSRFNVIKEFLKTRGKNNFYDSKVMFEIIKKELGK